MSTDFPAGKTEANTAAEGSLPTIYHGITLIKDGCILPHPIPHAAFLLSPPLQGERDAPLEHSLEPFGTHI